MTKIPKYKYIPRYAYKYASRTGKLSAEHEKVFLKDPTLAVDYAVFIKRDRLIKEVEDCVFDFYCTNNEKPRDCEKPKQDERKYFQQFFSYVKIIKELPKQHEENLLNSLSPSGLVQYAMAIEKRIDDKYEKEILDHAISTNKMGNLVGYFCAIETKLPEDMHNLLIANSLGENNTTTISYFNGLKNMKNKLSKMTSGFDKDMTIKEILEIL